jgi:hypothetical protein
MRVKKRRLGLDLTPEFRRVAVSLDFPCNSGYSAIGFGMVQSFDRSMVQSFDRSIV